MSESHASEYSNAVFNAISCKNTGWSVVHVRSEINSLITKFFHDVSDFIVNFSVHAEVRSGEVLPWDDLFLWHWWVVNLILVKIFQTFNYTVDFISFSVNFMGVLFLGRGCVYFVLLSILIHNSLLLC